MSVPKNMQDKYDEIAALIAPFCDEYLNDEYKALCLHALEKLCRKRPSPLLSGRARTRAGGILYAVGQANFLFDKSQTPHMKASELAERIGRREQYAFRKGQGTPEDVEDKLLQRGVGASVPRGA